MTEHYDIEYCMVNGRPYFDLDKDEEYFTIQVLFSAYPRWTNDGIGPYEFWGQKGFDKGQDYVELPDDPTWDRHKHTLEENAVIDAFKADAKRWSLLCDHFCEDYAKEEPDDPRIP